MVSDDELLHRAIVGFGEWIVALADGHVGAHDVIRRSDAIGARLRAAADNPWFSAVVVPPGAAPPPESDDLPTAVWTIERQVPRRVERVTYAMPCMGIELARMAGLDGPAVDDDRRRVEPVPRDTFAAMNEQAYGGGADRWFAPFLATLRDPRVRLHGLRGDDGAFASVALTIDVGEDTGFNFVTTDPAVRGRGYAARLARAVLADARARGLRTASLQSTGDGLALWRALGFREVGVLRAFLRKRVGRPAGCAAGPSGTG